MQDGLIEVIIFLVGLIGGWVLTSRSKPTVKQLQDNHEQVVTAEKKRAKAKAALAAAKHEQTVRELEAREKKIKVMRPRDLAAKVRDLFGGK